MFIKFNSTDPSENPIGRPISTTEQLWIGSILNIGAVVGSGPSGWLAYKFGRKVALLSLAIPHVIGFIIYAFPVGVPSYYVGRFISGIAVGGGYALLPMYVGEISKDSNRGLLTVTLNVFWNFGNCFSFAVGPFMSSISFNLLILCFPVCFFLTFLIFAPESPYYLLLTNNVNQAENSLMLLRSKTREEVQGELTTLRQGLHEEPKSNIRDLFKSKAIIKSLILCVVLIVFQQLSGFNAILYYGQPIFEISGSPLRSEINSVILGFVIFLSGFTTPFIADKCGRRVLLIISNIGMFLSHFTFGAYFYLYNKTQIDTTSISFIPTTGLVLFMFFYNIGVSPIPWTLCSELFPSHIKSIGASTTSCVMWSGAFFVTNFFNQMVQGIDMHGTFWLFGGFSLLSAAFVFLFLPETCGKSFEEIQKILDGKTLQWPSKQN